MVNLVGILLLDFVFFSWLIVFVILLFRVVVLFNWFMLLFLSLIKWNLRLLIWLVLFFMICLIWNFSCFVLLVKCCSFSLIVLMCDSMDILFLDLCGVKVVDNFCFSCCMFINRIESCWWIFVKVFFCWVEIVVGVKEYSIRVVIVMKCMVKFFNLVVEIVWDDSYCVMVLFIVGFCWIDFNWVFFVVVDGV